MGEEIKKREVAGWTMIIVIILCLLLVAIATGFPIWGMISGRVKVNATDALVRAIATGITTYQTKTWTWNEGTASEPHMRSGHIFDLNGDTLIDGFPAVTAGPTHDGGFSKPIIDSGYAGYVDMVKPSIKRVFISSQGIPIDAWSRPLRIVWAAKVYGTTGFGVWSAGPDGKDGTTDDLQSWTPVPTTPTPAP